MTNEQIVSEIRNGYSVTNNMQALYEKNLPLIRTYIKPYTAYEPLEDLLQESYFGLWEAVNHYETAENTPFMLYAKYWIKQAAIRHIEKCGFIIRVPSHARQRMIRYKKTVYELGQELGRTPTDKEIADRMGVSVELLPKLRIQLLGVSSLDTPLADDDNLTLADTLQGDSSPENDVIDKIYDEHSKKELWGIVERYTYERENRAIREYFLNGLSYRQIAEKYGLSHEAVRDAKERGLRRLRIGKARRELREKFDIVDAGMYRNSFNQFNVHGFTSTVEYIALRKAEIQAEYEERMRQLFQKS